MEFKRFNLARGTLFRSLRKGGGLAFAGVLRRLTTKDTKDLPLSTGRTQRGPR